MTKNDVLRASTNLEDVHIGRLPLDAFSALGKFHKLKRVRFHSAEGIGADDLRLEALSRHGFTNLFDFTLLNCPKVTDRGIEHLTRLPAVRYLQLEGTSISDAACKILAAKPTVRGVNVSNCPRVTLRGVLDLAESPTIDELGFSFGGLTQQDALRVIEAMRNAKWCGILDPKGEVDDGRLKAAAEAKGIKLVLFATGALQAIRGEPTRSWKRISNLNP